MFAAPFTCGEAKFLPGAVNHNQMLPAPTHRSVSFRADEIEQSPVAWQATGTESEYKAPWHSRKRQTEQRKLSLVLGPCGGRPSGVRGS